MTRRAAHCVFPQHEQAYPLPAPRPARAGAGTAAPAALAAQIPRPVEPLNFRQWHPEIQAFVHQDSLTPPPAAPIVFTGSSSVRKWETLAQDFPAQPVLNRGFGGSRFPDALHYFDTLVTQYHPKQVVLYEGDNDLEAGATPEAVYPEFPALRGADAPEAPARGPGFHLHQAQPGPLGAVAANGGGPTPKSAPTLKSTRSACATSTSPPPCSAPTAAPRPELYVEDGLHMTPAGYAIWTQLVGPYLRK